MNKEKFLPLGTVVLLKEAKKKVMIVGFIAQAPETGNKVFDYIGCLYPEGLISSEQNLLFNHNQIQQIYYIGYSDDEWKNLEPKIQEIYKKMINGEINLNQ